jgi:Domain of unknown function (DUF4337)
MAEVEIHTGHGHDGDPFGARVGVLVGIIGILLAGVTIESHRAHTAAIVHKTEANDQWAFYQAKKIRGHVMEVGATVLDALGTDPARVTTAENKLKADSERYEHDAEVIQKQAERREHESERAEHQALRFDLGEGLLELGLVLSSLYFLSKRKFFPALGALAALVGSLIGVSGLLL